MVPLALLPKFCRLHVLAARWRGCAWRHANLKVCSTGLRHASGSSKAEKLRKLREQWGEQTNESDTTSSEKSSSGDSSADDIEETSNDSSSTHEMVVQSTADLQAWV